MIREIRIRNYALINDLSLEFDKGFTIFTGETGAGKSILVGAISLLVGERASTDQIRAGADEADITGVFDVDPGNHPLNALLEELSIEPQDDQIIMRRIITRTDRNRVLINQTPVPLSSLKRLGDLLVDLHGQHEHQSLLTEESHADVIDGLSAVRDLRSAYDRSFQRYRSSQHALDSFEAKAAALIERKEVLEYQCRELDSLALHPHEEEEIETELRLLCSGAERSLAASEILSLLSSSQDAIEQRTASVRKKLEVLAQYDAAIAPWLDDVTNALATFTELETFMGSYLDKTGLPVDPSRIEHLNSRLATIQRLKKKHHCDFNGLLARRDSLRESLDIIGNVDADREEVLKNRASALQACIAAGGELSRARRKAAKSFDKKITALMEQLGFNGGTWQTGFTQHEAPALGGLETIRFMVQTNPGEPLLPLASTASGGEISRLMLAVKTVMSSHDLIPVLIFDEIDSGIGGILAGNVAKALSDLSENHQVLCITHLHQIASCADHHFTVYKEQSGDRTVTRVKKLSPDERVPEIARMLGGDSTIAKKHAEELLGKS
ncbi:MAG: DNA repair protein RecN [Chitinispirillaceae bacterium]|nr:DNA repair protein RecN [Chitinispirillaceae bacterium]